MRIKIFDEHVERMQGCVQKWMDDYPGIKIHHVAQSQGPNINFATLTIFYTIEVTSV